MKHLTTLEQEEIRRAAFAMNHFKPKQANEPKGEKMENKTLTKAVIKEMREKFVAGATTQQIADEYAAQGYVNNKGTPLSRENVSCKIRFKKGRLRAIRAKFKAQQAGIKTTRTYTKRSKPATKPDTRSTDFLERFIESSEFTAKQKLKFLAEMVK